MNVKLTGEDVNGIVRAIIVDSAGKLKVVGTGITLSDIPLKVDANGQLYTLPQDITTTSGKIRVDGSGNVYTLPVNAGVQPLVSDTYNDRVLGSVLAAGANTVSMTTFPANFWYQIDSIAWAYTGTIATVTVQTVRLAGGLSYFLEQTAPTVSGKYTHVPLTLLCKAGEILRFVIANATVNDTFSASICGHKFGV